MSTPWWQQRLAQRDYDYHREDSADRVRSRRRRGPTSLLRRSRTAEGRRRPSAVNIELDVVLLATDGAPVISEIRRISKPGRRVYSAVRDLPLVRNGLGISVLSTPKGVMSDAEARTQNVGGEILCRVS